MTNVTVDYTLFADIKSCLNITWDDENTNRNVRNYVTQGMFFINDKLGEEGDYLNEGYPRTLLFEYVRYARDGAIDVFENNYRSMILAMQNDRKVKSYAEKNTVQTGE